MIRQSQEMEPRYKDMDRRLPKQKELGGFLQEISGNLAKERLDNFDLTLGQEPPVRELREAGFNWIEHHAERKLGIRGLLEAS